jgi:CspA family cold shock protein
MADVLLGKVKWFNDSKGIGFIEQENADDIFVHYSGIVLDGHRSLKKGQIVSFRIEITAYGKQAVGVKPAAMGD